jgi:hypothetical protein
MISVWDKANIPKRKYEAVKVTVKSPGRYSKASVHDILISGCSGAIISN